MNIKKIYIILLIVIATGLYSSSITELSEYTIEFPEKWEIMKGVMDTDVIAIAPKINPDDLFRENVNIIHAKLELPITPKEYYDFNLKSLGQILTDFDLEDSEDVKVDGFEAKKLVFTHTIGVVNAKVLQYLILHENKAYVLTFTADPLDFKEYQPIFEKIVETFKFKKEVI